MRTLVRSAAVPRRGSRRDHPGGARRGDSRASQSHLLRFYYFKFLVIICLQITIVSAILRTVFSSLKRYPILSREELSPDQLTFVL